jgi:hypothetical protein
MLIHDEPRVHFDEQTVEQTTEETETESKVAGGEETIVLEDKYTIESPHPHI